MLTDFYAGRAGLLQRLEPRCKLIIILILIAGVSLFRSPLLVWGVYLLTLIFAAASRIEIPFFLKRVWLFVPIFAMLIILPALFTWSPPALPCGWWSDFTPPTPSGLTIFRPRSP